ncbi:hypothetical protein GQ43DRAFT_362708, partial [Delitschia confertaspora ATCC 74209]
VPLRTIKTTFTYNLTFSLPPTLETNAAWDALLPEGAGFISHPQLSPSPSAFSAFHQLHCLNLLRLGYYHHYNETNPSGSAAQISPKSRSTDDHDNSTEETAELQHHLRPAHQRHCFDYLRQSILCAADSNLEPVDFGLGGVTGWGSSRKCRDYSELVSWAEKWKSGATEGIS